MRIWMTLFLLVALAAGCSSGTSTDDATTEAAAAATGEETEPATVEATTEPAGTEAATPEDAATGTESATAEATEEAAAPPEQAVVQLGIQEGAGSNLPSILAVQQGFFEERGITIEFVPLQGSALLSSIVSGSVQFFSQAPQLAATAQSQGANLQFFCGNVPNSWTTVMAPVGSGLPSTATGATWDEVILALEGQRLGVSALGATQEFWARALAATAGADINAITLTPIGVGPAAIAALDGDQVDALLGYPFLEQQLVARGDVEVLFAFAEDGPLAGEMNTGWIGAGDWLDANPNTANAICGALSEAMAFFQDDANRDTVEEVLEQDYGFADPAVRAEVIDGVLPLFDPELHCDRLEQALAVFAEFGAGATGDLGCDTLIWSGAA